MNAEENHRDDQDDLDPWYSRTGFNYSEKVQQLRDRLYDAAKADPKRRLYSLRDKIFRKDVLEDACKYLTFRRHLKGFREKEYPDSFLIKELGLYDLTGGIISYVGL